MLLSSCLDIVKTRDRNPGETYKRIFEEGRTGLLKASSTESVLGSLLAFNSMLSNQHIVGYMSIHVDTDHSRWRTTIETSAS